MDREKLVATAANLWSGEELPEWEKNEYLRGQVELIADSTPNVTGDGDAEKDLIHSQIKAAVK